MRRYLARRLLRSLVVLWGLTVVVFGIARLSGNPVDLMLPMGAGREQRAQLIHALGLDRPLPVQYLRFIGQAVRGDFGQSIRFQAPAMRLVLRQMPNTVELAAASLLLAVTAGVPLGILAALRYRSTTGYLVSGAIALGQATPSFWLGILLILYVGVRLRLLPFTGNEGLSSLIMPAVTLSLSPLVSIARLTRSSLLGVLPLDYIRTARAKGLAPAAVTCKHALRNGLIPVVTITGIHTGSLLSGAVITEQIFAWPGIGRLAVESIFARDYPVVQAITLITSVVIVGMNLLVDLSYSLLDPRVRYA